MKTRFGTSVFPVEATSEGWLKVRTEDGRDREWHISEMFIEGNESPSQTRVINEAKSQMLNSQGGCHDH